MAILKKAGQGTAKPGANVPGLDLRAGIGTTLDRCPAGLPCWQLSEVGYHHGDKKEHSFAVSCLFFAGFNIPEYDLWLSALGACGAQHELIERRGKAREALYANNNDAVFRHLEWMMLRQHAIKREQFLLPLAKGAHQTELNRMKGLSGASERRTEIAVQNSALVLDLLSKVSPNVRNQGLAATARAIQQLAKDEKSDIDTSKRIANLGQRQLENLTKKAIDTKSS